nr:transcriptional regulator [Hoeflea marina]
MTRLTLMAAVMAWTLMSAPARAAELVMFEQAGCVWCARFNAEIAPAYARTDEGQRAPLRRVDIHAPIPADLAAIPIERFTPSFVLVEDGKEYGRIRGYPGDEFFWFRLDELLSALPKSVRPSVSRS